MRVTFSILIVIAFLAPSFGLSSNSSPSFFGYRNSSNDPVDYALRQSGIKEDEKIQIRWKKINLQSYKGRFFNVNLVVCKNANIENCWAVSQLTTLDKFDIPQTTSPRSIHSRVIGQILARNDVKNLRMGIRLVNEDGITKSVLEFESFTLQDLVSNTVVVKFSDNSELEVTLI